MRARLFLFGAVLSSCIVAQAAAQGTPFGTCEFRDQVAEAIFQSVEKGGAIGEEAKPLLASLSRLTAKAAQPNVTIDKQLAPQELAEFQKASQMLALLQARELVERRRQRDLQVFNRMVALADQSYRFGIEPSSDGGRDDLIYSSLRVIREALEEQPFAVSPEPPGCNIGSALFQMKAQALARVVSFDLAKVRELGDSLKAKYGMSEAVERDRLAPEDRQKWDAVIKEIVIPSGRVRLYVLDLEAALFALRASDLLYASDMKDAVERNGDLAQVGASIRMRAEANEFDRATVAAVGVWRLANENSLIQ